MTSESTALSLFSRVGGEQFFLDLVDAFYDGVETDEVLAPLYPENPDFSGARRRLALFLIQYWGGPTTYSDERGHPRLRMRHFPFHVGPAERDRWLAHMAVAIDATCTDDQGDVAAELNAYFVPAAEHLRNDTGLPITSRELPEELTVAAIEVEQLVKAYGDVQAVDDVSFNVAEGEVYGLLGHNGAGKSTTVEILEGHRRATAGAVSVMGMNPATTGRELRDRIGIVLQSSQVEDALTVREALRYYGSCYRRRRDVDDVIEMVGLVEKADERIGTLSGGQKRRVDLGLGIIGTPEVLFLDEPTTGFDPVARRQSWELVQRLCDGGATVLLTTHYLDEAEHLADRVGVLAGGRLVAEGTPRELMSRVPDATISFELPAGITARELGVPTSAEVDAHSVRIRTESPTAALAPIISAAVDRGIELMNLSVRRPSLEDVFLRLGDDGDGLAR